MKDLENAFEKLVNRLLEDQKLTFKSNTGTNKKVSTREKNLLKYKFLEDHTVKVTFIPKDENAPKLIEQIEVKEEVKKEVNVPVLKLHRSVEESISLSFDSKSNTYKDEAVANFYIKKINEAKRRNIEFSISLYSFMEIVKAKQCYYTGYVYKCNAEKSLDRLDNDKGYVEGNVVSCLSSFNTAKDDLTLDEIQSIYRRMIKGKKQVLSFNLPNDSIEVLQTRIAKHLTKKPLTEFHPFL
jgi:hypothetical protein